MNATGYLYDGSFEGLLTCIYEAYYRHENPGFILSDKAYRESIKGTLFQLLDSPLRIDTDMSKSEKVYNAVENKISAEAMETIYNVFLSEVTGFEIMTLDYVRLGFKTGYDLNKLLQDKRVMDMLKTERKVIFEVHRMHGFLRFQERPGFYYAPCEPDHNITALLTPHFAQRLQYQDFIIHDVRRGIASVCRRAEWFITIMEGEFKEALLRGEGDAYEDLWKGYFSWASIVERKNPKNQKRQMPKRYWKHLTEFE
jgi:probable DNA metabolism protein